MSVEVWTTGVSYPGITERTAVAAEEAGFDGLVLVDSQNLAGDVYVALSSAARVTERLKLATGVTNPVTRHPAVTASAIGTIQMQSGGRAVLGIGRGDSSLGAIGLAPAPVAVFADYLERLQGYLRGEEVEGPPGDGEQAGIEALPLAGHPPLRIVWMERAGPKVPLDVAATGPRVIEVGARLADRVTLAVGADAERVAWAVGLARGVRDNVPLGAFVNVVVHPDRAEARRLASGGLATFTRFSAMHGRATGKVNDGDRAVMEGLVKSYDMRRHTRGTAPHAQAITDDFAFRFGILGPAADCVARLEELIALGIERFVVVGPSPDVDREGAEKAHARFVSEVLPALQGGLGGEHEGGAHDR